MYIYIHTYTFTIIRSAYVTCTPLRKRLPWPKPVRLTDTCAPAGSVESKLKLVPYLLRRTGPFVRMTAPVRHDWRARAREREREMTGETKRLVQWSRYHVPFASGALSFSFFHVRHASGELRAA